MNNNLYEINLEFTPHTKALLEIYTTAADEELVVTIRYLKSELIRLDLTSNLVDLIIYEYMKSSDYDGRTDVSLEDINLNYTPHTKHLLKQYLSNQHEGIMEPTLENLKKVLMELHDSNNLGTLIQGEWIYSPGGIEPEINFELDSQKRRINNLKMEIDKELKTLTKFLSFRDRCLILSNTEFNKSCKKYKYLNFNEENNDVIFSNEPLRPVHITSEGKINETLSKLSKAIDILEKKIGELINLVLEDYGIELPPNFGFTTYED